MRTFRAVVGVAIACAAFAPSAGAASSAQRLRALESKVALLTSQIAVLAGQNQALLATVNVLKTEYQCTPYLPVFRYGDTSGSGTYGYQWWTGSSLVNVPGLDVANQTELSSPAVIRIPARVYGQQSGVNCGSAPASPSPRGRALPDLLPPKGLFPLELVRAQPRFAP
jgi:hypothetical protein